MEKIRVGIVGYGNLGRGVEKGIKQNPDMELVGIFTRRQPDGVSTEKNMIHISDIEQYKGKVDVMLLCGGSATDLPEQGPQIAAMFNIVDSYDTHAKIPEYFDSVETAAKSNGHACVISTGWDPGLFSLNRLLAQSILPEGKEYTFWGKGVSQGHSDAIRRIDGVLYAVQYTLPIEEAVSKVRNGEEPELSTKEKHLRDCYVVAKPGADLEQIKKDIVTMPNYFADYDTKVQFLTEVEFKTDHTAMPHGGHVMRSGKTGENNKQIIEFSLALESNPEFTASVMIAYARAINKFAEEGFTGVKTVFDIPFGYLSPKSAAELRKELL